MQNQGIVLGSEVSFSHRQVTRLGKVMGVEHVDDPRRRAGWHYFVRTPDSEILDVHLNDIGALIQSDVGEFA
jgi:hypothetical protein